MVEQRWPGLPVIPRMSAGATDGLFFRNAGMPVYGMSGCFGKPGEWRAHGLDEKMGIAQFHECVEFWYDLLKTLAG
jgi:acetylornithine deacetylase/succinyl-diaminopimelate desuccinylase-like protein